MNEPATPGSLPPSANQPPKTEGLAIASMVCGIVGFVSCGLTGIAAAILGHKANKKIARSNGALGGSGFATAGLVTGYISIVVGGILGLAGVSGLVAPVILRQKKAAERTLLINNMRLIGLGFLEFDMEYGSLPSDETAPLVVEAHGIGTPVGELQGSGVLGQLGASILPDYEELLTVPRMAEGDWWYFGGKTNMAPGRAVLISPAIDGERVVLRMDCSVERTRTLDPEQLIEEQGEPVVIPAPRKGGGS